MGKLATVDDKGRLKIPVSLLSNLRKRGMEFYITSETGDSVRIYPLEVWNEVEHRLERMSLHNRGTQKLLTRAKYFGQIVEMDDQGRVLIPPVLRKAAQMRGEVDVLEYENYLEVWNHGRLLRNFRESPVTDVDIRTLSRLGI